MADEERKQYALIMHSNMRVVTRNDKQEISDVVASCRDKKIGYTIFRLYPNMEQYTPLEVWE